ncbi:MAG: hypothetical protein H0U49_01025 [Parachlamydiaceae bacterium]|nr:hypothetical protein [Parachlamydiaceae bacterium]
MLNNTFIKNDALIAGVQEDYKTIVHGDKHKVGPIGHETTLKEIGACCGRSRGMIVTFFSRLSVLFRKHIWLNEKTINEYLDIEHFDKLSKTVAKIEIVRDHIRASKSTTNKIHASTPAEHKYILKSNVKLDQMDRRLQRINELFKERINQRLEEHPELKFRQPIIVPNQPWSMKDVPPASLPFKSFAGVQIAEKLADQSIVKENVQLVDLQHKAATIIGDVAMNHVNQAIGLSLPKIFRETVSSAIDIRGIATTGVSNLLDFLKTNYLASTRGKNVIENLPVEYKENIREYINLEMEIDLIKNSVGHPKKDKLHILELRKEKLDVLVNEIKGLVEKDSIGSAIPIARDAAISAADRYFNGLTKAVTTLKENNPHFNDIPSQIRQFMILIEMKQINEAAPENERIHTPIFVPTLEQSEQDIIDDLVKLINSGVKPKDFDDNSIVLLGGMEEEIRLKFEAGDSSMDKKLGDLGKTAMQKLLFPHGIPLGGGADWALKLAGKNFKDLEAEVLTKVMKIILEKVTDPYIINEVLEHQLDRAFDKIADIKGIEIETLYVKAQIETLKQNNLFASTPEFQKLNKIQLDKLEERLQMLNEAKEKKIEIIKVKAEIETARQKFNVVDDVLSMVIDLEEYNKNEEHIQRLNYKLAKLEGKVPETIEELFYNRLRAGSKNSTEGMGNPEMTDKYVNVALNLANLTIPEENKYERELLKAADRALKNKPENQLKIQKMIEQPINDLAMSFDNRMLIKLIQMGLNEILDEKGNLDPKYFNEDGTIITTLPTEKEREVQMHRIKGKIDQLTSAGINLGKENAFLKPFLPSNEMIAAHSNNLYNILTMSEVNKVLVTEMFASITA